ncbi:bis-aminopropyl spermidine synthase family protein [Candidatus Woesearchaeota archaeon]|nr:bis-aminopropyl spermidine synthase family protein [Candidatus Woesearchaeota archaeon]
MEYSKLIIAADNLMVSPRELESFLFMLKNGPVKQIELQRGIGFPSSVMRQLPLELSDIVLRDGDRFSLRESKEAEVDQIFKRRTAADTLFEDRLRAASDEMEKIEKSRSRSYRDFDQFRATCASSANKVRLMYGHGSLEGRDILFMGDNDLVSFLAAYAQMAKRLVVLDIDKELVALIQKINDVHGTRIEVQNYNAKRRIPQEHASSYQVAVTDPPYTPEGIFLFLSRCLSALKGGGVVYLNFGYSQRSREKAIPVQELLSDMGLAIEEVRNGFTQYHAAQSIGCRSSLYVLKTTPRSMPLIKGDFSGNIYTKIRQK